MRRRAVLMCALAAPAAAPAQGGVVTVTRLVKQFLEIEGELLDAQRSGDVAALSPWLADDFELRQARQPGTPVPRTEWLAALRDRSARPPAQASIGQMAVHALGPVHIVSFLLSSGTPGARPLFIVDAWTRTDGRWLLQVRYASEGTDPPGPG